MFRQISIFLPNKPGVLAGFMELLMENKIFIYAMTVAETEDYGLLLLLVNKTDECIQILDEKDFLFTVTDVIAVKLADNVGGLYNVSKLFGDSEVNIEYLYSTLVEGEAILVLRVNNHEKAIELLNANNYILMDQKEL
jgi:hypothetical protein